MLKLRSIGIRDTTTTIWARIRWQRPAKPIGWSTIRRYRGANRRAAALHSQEAPAARLHEVEASAAAR